MFGGRGGRGVLEAVLADSTFACTYTDTGVGFLSAGEGVGRRQCVCVWCIPAAPELVYWRLC